MADAEVDRFAEALMRRVRDRAIAECDRLAAGEGAGPSGERWGALVSDESARRVLEELIPDIVDQVLFELLSAGDNDELGLGWRRSDGSLVSLEELGSGELAGWLMGSGGWQAQFSSQRFFDPFGDLRLDLDDTDFLDES
jgi:hypothetical protein